MRHTAKRDRHSQIVEQRARKSATYRKVLARTLHAPREKGAGSGPRGNARGQGGLTRRTRPASEEIFASAPLKTRFVY